MILAVSRFRVRDEDVPRVQQAFVNRPRRVEDAAGFQGMEVFNDSADPNLFCLVTRWSDPESYRRWHSSKEHHLSHSGIPKGIHLDPSFTKVEVLYRIDGAGGAGLQARVAEWELLMGRYLEGGDTVFVVAALPAGTIVECNRAFARMLGREHETVPGIVLWDCMTESDARKWKAIVAGDQNIVENGVRLNLVDATDSPRSLLCFLRSQPGFVAIVGSCEPLRENSRRSFIRINNELAVISRESTRRRVELERANAALRRSAQSLDELAIYLTDLRDRERRNLQQALHEGVAQTVAAAAMELSRVSKSGTTDALENALELVRNSCAELRRLATDLHPPGLQVFGLMDTLEDWAGRYGALTGVSVALDLPLSVTKLPGALDFEVFRLVQEGVDLIAESGGRTASVWLRINRFRIRCVIEGNPFANSDVRHSVQFGALETRARKLGGAARYSSDTEAIKLFFSVPLSVKTSAD